MICAWPGVLDTYLNLASSAKIEPEAEYARWVKAAEQIDDEWVKTASAKGANGKQLLDEARALITQYSK